MCLSSREEVIHLLGCGALGDLDGEGAIISPICASDGDPVYLGAVRCGLLRDLPPEIGRDIDLIGIVLLAIPSERGLDDVLVSTHIERHGIRFRGLGVDDIIVQLELAVDSDRELVEDLPPDLTSIESDRGHIRLQISHGLGVDVEYVCAELLSPLC